MLLAIPPFKSARARAIGARMSAFGGCSTTSVEGASAQGDASLTPVQAPKTASLLVSRPWPWTCAVATSSTSWKRWRGRPPRQERMSSPARTATFTSTGWIIWPKVATRPSSHLSSVGAYCPASGYSSDCRLDFDDGGRREEKRVLVGLNPVSKAVRSPLARRQAFEQSSVNQPTCHRHFPCLMLVELEIDIKVMRKSQESLPEFRGVRRVVRSVGSFTLYGRDLGKRFAIVREDN